MRKYKTTILSIGYLVAVACLATSLPQAFATTTCQGTATKPPGGQYNANLDCNCGAYSSQEAECTDGLGTYVTCVQASADPPCGGEEQCCHLILRTKDAQGQSFPNGPAPQAKGPCQLGQACNDPGLCGLVHQVSEAGTSTEVDCGQ